MTSCLAAALPYKEMLETRAMQVARVAMLGNRSNGIRTEQSSWWKRVIGSYKWRMEWSKRTTTETILDVTMKNIMSPSLAGKNLCQWPQNPVDGNDMGPTCVRSSIM